MSASHHKRRERSRAAHGALGWIVGLLFFVAACGGKEPEQIEGCIPGRAELCECDDGTPGIQTCSTEGLWTSCDCTEGSHLDAGVDVGGDAFVDAGDERNACGGLEVLTGGIGQSCGECADGTLVCDGAEALQCVGAWPRNICGSCRVLRHAVGDVCGACGQGRWECAGSGDLVCVGDKELNDCGGCTDFDEARGFACAIGDQTGTWQCATRDELICLGPGKNACGGMAVLAGVPGTACGTCSGGRWICTSPDAVICDTPEAGVNACGGCAPLGAELGESCGECGGSWQCNGTERLKCSEGLSLCGACSPLSALPGESCGEGLHQVCHGQDSVACADTSQFNACGGTGALTAMPGSPCGPCLDGYHICASAETVVCVGARTHLNACNGCTDLWAEPRQPCGADQVWLCDDSGDRLLCVDVEVDSANACGGTEPLEGRPGDTCEACGEWGCSSFDLNRLVCMNGSIGLDRDRNHCGACGRACEESEACVDGSCVADDVVSIGAGRTHTCALRRSGRVYCWGSGASGHLGTTGTQHHELPVEVFGLEDAVELAVGSRFACAVRETGDVACWGLNNRPHFSRHFMMLGLASTNIAEVFAPVDVPALHGVHAIAAGPGFSCGINGASEAVCWGSNEFGQLGRGIVGGALPPGVVPGLEDVVEVTVGGWERLSTTNELDAVHGHACARQASGEVYCWGHGQYGQNGRDDGQHWATPQKVEGIEGAVSIGASQHATCAARDDGGLWCWGYNEASQLARQTKQYGFPCLDPNGCYISPIMPEATQAPTTMAAATITGSGSTYNCAVTESGKLWCWGSASYGALGLGTTARQDVPVQVEFYGGQGRKVVQVAAGFHHLCVLVDSGQVYCAGRSDAGGARLLGDNQLASRAMDRYFPTPVVGLAPHALYEAGLCRDGSDNDGNGAVDCADLDCATDLGSVAEIVVEGAFDGSEGNYFQASCGTTNGREQVYSWTAPADGPYVLSTEGSAMITTLYVLATCEAGVPGAEIACDSFSGEDNRSRLVLEATAGQRYAIVVDGSATASLNSYVLSISPAL